VFVDVAPEELIPKPESPLVVIVPLFSTQSPLVLDVRVLVLEFEVLLIFGVQVAYAFVQAINNTTTARFNADLDSNIFIFLRVFATV